MALFLPLIDKIISVEPDVGNLILYGVAPEKYRATWQCPSIITSI